LAEAFGQPLLKAATTSVRRWLRGSPLQFRGTFLKLCAAEAAEEGSTWSLSLAGSDTATREKLPAASRLHGLAVFQRLLQEVLPESGTTAENLLKWALEEASRAHRRAQAWGHVAAAVVQRCIALPASKFPRIACGGTLAIAARAEWRSIVREAAASRELSAQVLHVAASVERWATVGKTQVAAISEDTPADDSDYDDEIISLGVVRADEPLIVESKGGSIGGAAAPTVLGDVDTSLLESHEQLLRWAQSARDDFGPGDAFADYVAATWSALVATSSEPLIISSRAVVRIHRFVLEFLGAVRKSPGIRWASPGSLRLVTALCASKLWPESGWSAALHAIGDAHALSLESCSEDVNSVEEANVPIAYAFAEDAAAAASALLEHVPESRVEMLVPILGAGVESLRAAAQTRLRRHAWVPTCRGGDAEKLLSKVEALLQEDAEGGAEASVQASSLPQPSCSDVAFSALSALVGKELANEAWAVEGVLGDFLSWEAEPYEDDSEEDLDSEAEDITGGSVALAPLEQGTSSGARKRRRKRERVAAVAAVAEDVLLSDVRAPMPTSLGRRCVASLGAWELMLHGLSSGAVPASSSTSEGPGAQATPAELVAAALQLAPEQLQGSASSSVWASSRGAAPGAQASSPSALAPLRPLFRLVCHALTSPRLAEFAATADDISSSASPVAEAAAQAEQAERRIARALAELSGGAAETPAIGSLEDAVFASSARVLLLSLRSMPAAVRSFWEQLPRRRDRDLVERLVTRSFASIIMQSEGTSAQAVLEAQKNRFPDVEATVARRAKQLVLLLERDELRAELCVQLPEAFPLRIAIAELPEKMPGIPRPRVRNWMLQARQVLAGPKPCGVASAMLMWSQSFALFFNGVEDCPICYNVVHLTTQTIPRKACPTCKHKFHNECLYHWWRSSAKTTCPLCNQPF